MAQVTIEIEEFDAMREKIKQYDELKKKYDKINDEFPRLLECRMSNVLSEIIEMQSGETDYSKKPKLNVCKVSVKHDVSVINGLKITIEKPNVAGYYNASIICNYDERGAK